MRDSGLQTEPDDMPPVPQPRQQVPLVSSAEDAEATGVAWIQHALVSECKLALGKSVSEVGIGTDELLDAE